VNDIPPPQVWPCGCFISYYIEDGVNTGRISPCKPDCEVLMRSLREVEDRGVQISKSTAP